MAIKKHLNYLRTDFRGECFFLYNQLANSWLKAVSKFNLVCKSIFLDIKIGKGIGLIGPIRIKRHQGSTISIGDNCTFISKQTANSLGLNHPCIISTNKESALIQIGKNCSFSGTSIAALQSIILEDNVRCGANTTITDSDWHADDPRSGGSADVYIGENVWLGVGSTVLKGVTIGKNSLIGANSLVVKDIPENVIAAGNPCKVIRQLP